MSYQSLVPMLNTPNLAETRAFYEDVLGFDCMGVFPQEGEPFWCSLRAGDAQLMLSYDEGPHTHDDGEAHGHDPMLTGALYFYPDDLDGLWARIQGRPDVSMELLVTDYGMREFRMNDPNGYELCFGQGA